jgi:hypothetical protein
LRPREGDEHLHDLRLKVDWIAAEDDLAYRRAHMQRA